MTALHVTFVTPRTTCVSAQQRSVNCKNKFDAYLNAGAAGAVYWSIGTPAQHPGDACNSIAAMDSYTSPLVTMTRAYTHPQLPVY